LKYDLLQPSKRRIGTGCMKSASIAAQSNTA
jgi:hypothetical protein